MLLSVSSTMGVVFDVAIVALLVIFGFIGLRKGFFKSVISILSTLVVLIISILGAGWLARLVNKIYDFTGLIAGKLCEGIASMGAFYSTPIPEGVSGADIIQAIPSSTNGFLKKLMSYVLKPLSASDIQGATVADVVSGAFASIIMLIISAIVLFILIKIVISIATRLFDNITRNRVFGVGNKLLGLAFGVVKGALIVFVFTIVLTLLTVIPAINTKMTPIIQDNTKLAKPIYNYTDEFIEKRVVDGKLVQKWIDNLWQNKYKDRGTNTPVVEPDGTATNPYLISLTENSGQYTATFTIDFSSNNDIYYKLIPSTVAGDNFSMDISIVDADATVFNSTDLEAEITNLDSLSKTETYIIKFTKLSVNSQIQTTITIIQN